MDALHGLLTKRLEKKLRRQLHKNAACNLEQVQAATPHKTPIVRQSASYHENYSSYTNQTCRSRGELTSDVLWWTLTYGRAKAERPARTYIQHLCEDTGCYPEDLPEAMNYREKWRERVRDIRATSTTWWYIYMYIYIYSHPQTDLFRSIRTHQCG